MKYKKIFYQIVKTSIGNITIVWYEQGARPKITEILLSKLSRKNLPEKYARAISGRNKTIEKFTSALKKQISGEKIRLRLNLLDLHRLKNFQRKVLLLTSRIPKGRVESYGFIAKKLGIPKGARAVGQALAKNPFPIVIPCHRVIKSDGSIGGFANNVGLKRKLLKIEGVHIK